MAWRLVKKGGAQ